jgi:hypothetical protein
MINTRGTKVTCTDPEVFASGSTFNMEWADFLYELNNGVALYFCQEDYLNDALIELSMQYPHETFSGVTWNDNDLESAIDLTFIIKNGKRVVLSKTPHYKILFPDKEDEEYNALKDRCREHILQYLYRVDNIKEQSQNGVSFDKLNDEEEDDGFISYFSITWANKEHYFEATKRYTSLIIVHYCRLEDLHKKKLDHPNYCKINYLDIS